MQCNKSASTVSLNVTRRHPFFVRCMPLRQSPASDPSDIIPKNEPGQK